jgi:RNA polymerase sigma factor (sigma-70 family)
MNVRPGLALLRHQRRLTSRFAARLGRSDAEDLAAEAVARGLARPAPDGRQEPWIETIFRNLLIDARRRAAHRQDARYGGPSEPQVTELPDAHASPEDAVLTRERGQALAAAMPAIPSELREAIVARFYDEQDYDQMAATTGISVTTARTRVWRALAQLRRSLQSMRGWLPATFGTGTPLSAAWLPAVAVAVLAIGPTLGTTTGAGDRGQLIAASGPESARTPHRLPHPITMAAVSQKKPETTRDVPKGRAPAQPRATDMTGGKHDQAGGRDQDDAAKPEAVRRFEFENDDITGEMQQPGFIFITGDPREVKMGSLIEIPRSFEQSMTKMIEDN